MLNILVAVAGLYGLVLAVYLALDYRWNKPREKKRVIVARSLRRSLYVTLPVVAVLAVVDLLWFNTGILSPFFSEVSDVSSAAQAAIVPFGEDKVGLLILPFDRLEDCKIKDEDMAKAVEKSLKRMIETEGLTDFEVRYVPLDTCPSNHAESRKIGELYNADIVVWGDQWESCALDSSSACLYYTLTDTTAGLEHMTGSTGIQMVSSKQIYEGELLDDVNYVTNFLLGQCYYERYDYRNAARYYEKATEIAPSVSGYLYLGLSYNKTSEYADAEHAWTAGLQLAQNTQNGKFEGIFAGNIGNIHGRRGDYDATLAWYKKSVAIKNELGDRAGLAATYGNIGCIHGMRGDYDVALMWYEKSVAISEDLGDRIGLATTYGNIGSIQGRRGDYDAALTWHEKSVAISEELGDRAGLATTYGNIGIIHKLRGDYDVALLWYEKSLAINEVLQDRVGLATVYANIGNVHQVRGEYDTALTWYEKSLAINEELGNRGGLSDTYTNIGIVHQVRGEYDTALSWYEKSVAIKEELGDRAGLAGTYNNIGNVYLGRSDYASALRWYEKSAAISEELEDRAGLATTYINMGILYQHRRNYDAALEYFNRSLKLFQEIGLEKDVNKVKALIAQTEKKMAQR